MKQEDENKNEKDDIDKYIENIVNKKISEPEGFEKAIREALYSDKFNKKLRNNPKNSAIGIQIIEIK